MSFLEAIFDLNWGDLSALGRLISKLPAGLQKFQRRRARQAEGLVAPTGGSSDAA